jgi:hypothetical protein
MWVVVAEGAGIFDLGAGSEDKKSGGGLGRGGPVPPPRGLG